MGNASDDGRKLPGSTHLVLIVRRCHVECRERGRARAIARMPILSGREGALPCTCKGK